MFAQLGLEKTPAISSWGEYISDVLMLQVHRADHFKHKDTAYVRVLENKDYKGNRGGLKRVEHVEAIKQGAKTYLCINQAPINCGSVYQPLAKILKRWFHCL